MEEIRVLVVEPRKKPQERMILNTLIDLRKIVGGHIEPIRLDSETLLLCNEEGKVMCLPENRALYVNGKIVDIIAGTFIICGNKGGDFKSLDKWQLKEYKAMFDIPQKFIRNRAGRLIGIENMITNEE